jgi:DNA-binding GntR family transcriptional regulator
LKAHLRIAATGKRAHFQPQRGWFFPVAQLDADAVLTARAVDYTVELAAAKRPTASSTSAQRY